MLFTFLLVVQAIIAAALVTVILMQRSEGGGLTGGGSPAGFMSARGAADFLTRATTVLATLFVGLSIVLAVIAATHHRAGTIDTSLVGNTADANLPAPGAADPMGNASAAQPGAPANGAAIDNGAVPLAN